MKLVTGKTIALEMASSATIRQVQTEIERIEGIPWHKQYLYYGGRQLNIRKNISDYNMNGENVLNLNTLIPGEYACILCVCYELLLIQGWFGLYLSSWIFL